MDFLTSMPHTSNIVAWIEQFKRTLYNLLDDIDNVSVFVNIVAGLSKPEQKWLLFFVRESPFHNSLSMYMTSYMPGEHIAILPEENTGYDWEPPRYGHMLPFSSRVYNRLKKSDPRVLAHHEPLTFEYHTEDEANLGAIFLWRKLDRPPLSETATKILIDLHDYIMFAFECAIARAELERPMFRGTFKAMTRLTDTAGLLEHEGKVVAYLLMGMTYEQIADKMNISVNTIRKYVKNAYRKAEVHSLGELFAKYFLPLPG